MKSNFIYTFFFLAFMAVIFSSNNGGRATIGSGNSGAPGDEVLNNGQPWTCQGCHGTGSANGIQITQAFELTDDNGADIFTTGYTPGVTYNAKLTLTAVTGNPAKYGFQALCLNAPDGETGPQVSDWTAVSSNVAIRTVNSTGRKYAEHATGSTSNEFTMTWVAPAAGSGEVTFYISSNGANGNNGSTGDGATAGKYTLTENTSSSAKDIKLLVDLSLFPNPVADQLSVNINTEESGSYNWSVIDMSGRILQNGQFDLPQGESVQSIEVADVAAGLYQFQLSKDGKRSSQTLVKK